MLAEDAVGDYGVVYYRSRDPIKNLKIKVTLKASSTSPLVPEILEPIDKEVGSGGSRAESHPLMPLGSKRSLQGGKKKEAAEVYTFKWQEKAFSKRELNLYADKENLYTPLDHKYHGEVTKLLDSGGRTNSRLFTYVDHDKFADVSEESIHMTTSTNETPSPLAIASQNLRQRKKIGRKIKHGTGGVPYAKMDPVVHSTGEENKSSQLSATPFQMMYIMADLSPLGQEPTEEDEYVLCTIKVDDNGVLSIKPDLNRHAPPYQLLTRNASRDAYEYVVEQASAKMSRDELSKEKKMFRELYSRHTEYLAACVGTQFEMVPSNTLRLCVLGEILSAKNFENDNLYIHYFVELPKYWSADPHQKLAGITQLSRTVVEGRDEVAYFCFPFEFDLLYKNQEISEEDKEALPHWPQIFVEVLSFDSWQRYRNEGYGYFTIPSTPGSEMVEVALWRPEGNRVVDKLKRFFIGGSPELEDTTYAEVPVNHEGDVLSKLGFRTVSTGTVTVRLNTIQQSHIFMEKTSSKHKVTSLLDRLGGLGVQTSVQGVLELFQRARKRMQSARKGLSTL